MALRLVQVNFKARDDAALGAFWAETLGWELSSEGPGVTNLEPVGVALPDPVAVGIDVVSVPDPENVDYRVHLELASESASGYAELVARLRELGATSVDGRSGGAPGTSLADPDGNEFRVLAPHPAYRGTGPIAAVVVDCADPRALTRFWNEAIDWTLLGDDGDGGGDSTGNDYITGNDISTGNDIARLRSSRGVGPYLEFRRAAAGEAVRTRVHLDVRPYPADDQAAEVARLRVLGAEDIDIGQGDVPWTVLADIEGNEFCVLTPG